MSMFGNVMSFAAPAADTALNFATGLGDLALRGIASDSMGKEGQKQAGFMRTDVYPRFEEYGRAMEAGAQGARSEFENYRANLGPTAQQTAAGVNEQVRNTWQAANKSLGDVQEQAFRSGTAANKEALEMGRKRYEEGVAHHEENIARSEQLRSDLLSTTRADLNTTLKSIRDQVAVRLADSSAENEALIKNDMAAIDEAVAAGQMTPAQAQQRKMQAVDLNRQRTSESSRKMVADHTDMVRSTNLAAAELMERAGVESGKWVADAYTTRSQAGAQDRVTVANLEQNFVRNDMDINEARMQSEQYRAERGQAVETGIAENTMNAFQSDRNFHKVLADMAQGIVATEAGYRSTAATTIATMLQSYHANQFAMETAGSAALLGSSPLLNIPDMGSPLSTGFANQQALQAANQKPDTNNWFGPTSGLMLGAGSLMSGYGALS